MQLLSLPAKYLLLFFIPLLINPFGEDIFELPKFAFFIGFEGTAVFVLSMVILLRKPLSLPWHGKVFLFLLAWIAFLILSTLFSRAPLESFFGGPERYQGLLSFLLYSVHFFFCFSIFSFSKNQKMFFDLLFGVGSILSLLGLFQYFQLDLLPFSDATDASNRSYGTLGNPNFLGQFLILPIAALSIFIMEKKQYRTVFRTAIFILLSLGLIATVSRASLLGLGISLMIYALMRYHLTLQKILALITVLAVLLLGFSSVEGLRSVFSRTTLIKSSLPVLLENPLIGNGPETFYQTIQKSLSPEIFQTERLFSVPDRVHNEFFQVLLDQGILGGLLYLISIGFLIYLLKKRLLKSLSSKAAFYSILSSLIAVQFGFSLATHWVFLMALWAILLRETLPIKNFTLQIPKPFMFLASAALCTASFFLLFFSINLLRADRAFEQGIRDVVSEENPAKLEEAVTLNPWNRDYLFQLVLFSNNLPENKIPMDRLKNTIKNLRKLTGNSVNADLAEAILWDLKKDFSRRDEFFQRALEKAPADPLIPYLFTDTALASGQCDIAERETVRLKTLAKGNLNNFQKGHELLTDLFDRVANCGTLNP